MSSGLHPDQSGANIRTFVVSARLGASNGTLLNKQIVAYFARFLGMTRNQLCDCKVTSTHFVPIASFLFYSGYMKEL